MNNLVSSTTFIVPDIVSYIREDLILQAQLKLVVVGCRGYTTGLFMLGHAMATSEAAWVAAISRAIQAKEGVVGCITIPGVYYPRLINWALAAKLLLAR